MKRRVVQSGDVRPLIRAMSIIHIPYICNHTPVHVPPKGKGKGTKENSKSGKLGTEGKE